MLYLIGLQCNTAFYFCSSWNIIDIYSMNKAIYEQHKTRTEEIT